VMPRFGPEPKFKPEPGRTRPRSGLRFRSVAELDRWTGLEFRGWQYSVEPVLNLSDLNLIKVPKYLFE